MNILRWQAPVAQWPNQSRLSALKDEIDRLFEAPAALWARSSLSGGWSPALDVHEDKDHFLVHAELPGMNKEDIVVSFEDGALTISGERKASQSDETTSYRTERFVGRFHRTISLPSPVAVDKVQAQYKDGVLSVTLPKTEESKPRQIDVSVS